MNIFLKQSVSYVIYLFALSDKYLLMKRHIILIFRMNLALFLLESNMCLYNVK